MSDSPPTHPVAARGPAPGTDPAERLWRLWRQGKRPDVDAFLAQAGSLSPEQVAAVLRADQRERWRAGERILAENYLERHPAVRAQVESALDLIFNEFLLREQLGERPDVAEYSRRFPEHAGVLQAQIDLHQAMAGEPTRAVVPQEGSEQETLTPAALPGEGAAATFGVFPRLPPVFGRYRIDRVLGQGGMGTVYVAFDMELQRPVALKVPRLGEGADAVLIQRFYREARIAATFTHPHLCPVYDVGQVEGIYYLTMPLLPGEPLSAWLKREGPLPQLVAARFACLVARALEVAHKAGVIHRDLKPANVMVNERREPVVMDFGLARREATHESRVTASGAIVGTPAYLPPEQIGGDAGTMGPACDIYSLGVMLYEMLTGWLPFQGSASEVLRQVLVQPPEPPSRHCPDLDPRLETICLTALAKKPAARYPSMAQFAAALEEYLRPGDIPPIPAPGPIPEPHRRRRARWVVGMLLVGLGAVLLGGIVWLVVSLANQSERTDAATDTPQAGPKPIRENKPTVRPDGFQAGNHWSGTYLFRFPEAKRTDVNMTITERTEMQFKGVYRTLGGDYEWLIEGVVGKKHVSWGFTQANKGAGAEALVGKGTVKGTYEGKKMKVVFSDPTDDSVADMTLFLKK